MVSSKTSRKKDIEIDVSGYNIDERGKLVNKNIPEEERKKKVGSNSRNRLKKQKKEAAQKIEKEKSETKERKKRKRRTLGQLLAIDKKRGTSKAQKKALKLCKSITYNAEELEPDLDLNQLMFKDVNERDFQEEYNRIFTTLGNLCRKLELNMNDKDSKISSRDVYALMTMYSQMRETIADLRSITDVNTQSEILINEIFLPYHKTVGEMMLSLLYKIMTHLRTSLPEDKAHLVGERFKEIVSEEALTLQKQFESTKEKISTVLNASK